jgi:hypothetical protein
VSNGALADPSFKNISTFGGFNKIVSQSFLSSGTYTPTAGMQYCKIEVIGGGGGGGGGYVNGQIGGAGGGGGGYAYNYYSAAQVGASRIVTVGTGGSAGPFNADGGPGGTTTLPGLLSATGGSGGVKGGSSGQSSLGADAGVGQYANNFYGQPGFCIDAGGAGGGTFFGGGTPSVVSLSNGLTGMIYGSGGSGAGASSQSAKTTGGAGAAGIILITEYCSV